MPTPEYVKLAHVALPSTTSTTTRTVPVTYDATKRNAAYAAAYKINPHLSYADFVGMPTAEEIQAKQGEIKTAKPKTEQEKKDSKRAMEIQAYKEEEAKKEELKAKALQGANALLTYTLPTTWIDAGLAATGHPTYFRDYTTGEYKPHYLPAAIDDSHTNITPYTAFVTDLFGYSLANKAVRGATRVGNIYDNIFFRIHPDSWTRGIGMTDTGLRDLVLTGVVRGNPAGTETTAKIFGRMYRKNRDNFRSIMDDTGRDGIALRWFSRTLSKDDFNAIKESAKKFKSDSNFPTMDVDNHGTIRLLERDIDPLSNYSTYEDYTKTILAQIAETEKMPSRIASGEVTVNRDLRQPINGFNDNTSFLRGTPVEERFGPNSDYLADGLPLSYWYPDGRNAATRGHDYAGSKYFVRVNNASQHMPFMHDMHLHPSFLEAPKLSDPDVEVFKRGPFGLTFKMDKTKLALKYGNLLAPYKLGGKLNYLNYIRK